MQADRVFSVLVGIVSSVGALGCSDEPETTCPTAPPSITSFVVEPTSAAPGDTLTAMLVVEGFELGGSHPHTEGLPQHEPLHEDEEPVVCPGGHVHVYLDDLMTNPLAMVADASFPVPLPDDVTEGDHQLIARLQNYDHTIVKPEVMAEATIVIVAP